MLKNETLANTVPQGLAICGVDGRLLHFNNRYLELFPLIRDVIKPRSEFRRLIVEAAERKQNVAALKDDAGWVRARLAYHDSDDTFDSFFEHVMLDGRIIDVHEKRDKQGKITSIYSDVTHIKRTFVPSQAKALAPREVECLLWLSEGLRTDQIAYKLGVQPVTVSFHLRNARLKLGSKTREQMVAIAVKHKII